MALSSSDSVFYVYSFSYLFCLSFSHMVLFIIMVISHILLSIFVWLFTHCIWCNGISLISLLSLNNEQFVVAILYFDLAFILSVYIRICDFQYFWCLLIILLWVLFWAFRSQLHHLYVNILKWDAHTGWPKNNTETIQKCVIITCIYAITMYGH